MGSMKHKCHTCVFAHVLDGQLTCQCGRAKEANLPVKPEHSCLEGLLRQSTLDALGNPMPKQEGAREA